MRSVQTSTGMTPLTIVYDGRRWWCEGVEITGVQFSYSATTTFIELAGTAMGYEINQEDAAWVQLDQAPQKICGASFPTREASDAAYTQVRTALRAARPSWPVRLARALRRRFVAPVGLGAARKARPPLGQGDA